MLENEKSKSKPSFKEIKDSGTALKVENQNKIDEKPDDDSKNVEKLDDYDIPEISEKEIDDNLQEKVSLDNIYALEAAGNDENELLEDFEATEAESINLNNPKLPQLDLSATSFAKDNHVEHNPEETSEDIIGNRIIDIKEVEVVAGNVEDKMKDSRSNNNDITENDDDEGVDVNDEISSQ